MGSNSHIQWCHHTFNPWRGCSKVSPGCDNCYAEAMSRRNPAVLGEWGVGNPRAFAAEQYWRAPIAWDRKAREAGERHRVFCSSLSDVFEDREDLIPHRARLWDLINDTPNLDWLLLTKRPGNAHRMLDQASGFRFPIIAPRNIWIGTSVEDQTRAAERIPRIVDFPAAVRFLSLEPLLGPVDLEPLWRREPRTDGEWLNMVECGHPKPCGIDWVIVGGESGPDARACRLDWVYSVVEQCRAAGVPCFVKQLGVDPVEPRESPLTWPNATPGHPECDGDGFGNFHISFRSRKGDDPGEWPSELKVRQFPREKA